MQLRRPRALRDQATAPIAVAYLTAACVLGATAKEIGAHLLGDVLSPLASDRAEAILSAIASGMMALTAILFSLVFVAVQGSGTFFGLRLMRMLGRTPFLGHAVGVFTGSFVYALLAIRTIDIRAQPGVSVAVIGIAFLWLFGSITALLLLILRLRSLEIGGLLATLYAQTHRAVLRLHAPTTTGATKPAPATIANRSTKTTLRYDDRPRYLLGFDVGRLVRCARDADCVIHIPLAIGDPVVAGAPIAIISPSARAVDERTLRAALWFGPARIVDNDPAYGIRLLVDVAIRALSPAVNDPTTAVTVLDQLDGLLRVLADQRLEDNCVLDASGAVRLVFEVCGWDDLVALALTEIDDYGRDSRQVQRRMASLLDDLETVVPSVRRGAIHRFARWHRAAEDSVRTRRDERWAAASERDRQGLGHVAVRPDGLPHWT